MASVLLVGDVGEVDVVGHLELVSVLADVVIIGDIRYGAASLGLH